MGKRLIISLALVFATWPALPQQTTAPIQTAQPAEPPAVEQGVVLPELGWPDAVVIGVAAVVALGLLTMTQATSCDDSGDCGGPFPGTTTTGTR